MVTEEDQMSRIESRYARSRRRSRALPRLVGVASLAAAALAIPAWAHDTWLLPRHGQVKPGRSVDFSMTSGMAFPKDESAIDADRVARGGVRLGGVTEDFDRRQEGRRALRLRAALERPGIATVWLELKPRTIELTAEQVAHYVEEIGAGPAVLARWETMPEPRRWREAYRKHVKSFVRVGEPGDDRSWAEPVGSPLELVPEQDPTALRPGSELRLRLLRGGAPAAGASVALVRAGEERAVVRTTDAEGRAAFPLPRAGWYLVRSTDLRPAVTGELEWEADFATLTVEVKESQGR